MIRALRLFVLSAMAAGGVLSIANCNGSGSGGSTSTATPLPVANPQSVSTPKDTALAITLSGSSPDGSTLTYNTATPAHGTLTGTAPNVTYTPSSGYVGGDSFTFTVANHSGTSSPATVSIVVGLLANPQSVLTPQDTAVSIKLTGTAATTSSPTFTSTQPAHGALTGAAPNLIYTPNSGYAGGDSFTFTISDGTLTSPPATVTLAITPTAVSAAANGKIGHVFIVVLENENYTTSFDGVSAPFLSKAMVSVGALLPNYYGTGHESNDNYIAMVSGQGPNADTQADCQIYSEFVTQGPQIAPDGQAVGQGCVYPTSVSNITDQLKAKNLTWRGYMEDMGNTRSRESATCGHPTLNSQDNTQTATAADQYAARHNPFVYFHSIIDTQAYCDQHVVSLQPLDADLASVSTTPNYVFIVPNLCHDGHDTGCKDGEPGGLTSVNTFLQSVVPKILSSPAFLQDGVLIVTFDEAQGPPNGDSSACCGEVAGPNSPRPGINGPGGGVIGAVVISQFTKPATTSNNSYNHYSMLRSVEDWFGLNYLGYAGTSGQASFGADVFTTKQPQ